MGSTTLRLCLLGLHGSAIALLAACEQPQGSPLEWRTLHVGNAVVINDRIVDVGEVRPSAKRTVRLEATNRAMTTVEVVGLHTNCGCLKLPRLVKGQTILPDTAYVLDVIVDATGYQVGRFDQSVYVRVAQGGRRWTERIRVSGSVSCDLAVRPTLLDFGVVEPDREMVATLTLSSATNAWTVTGVNWHSTEPGASAPGFTFVKGEGNESQLRITCAAPSSNGVHSRSLRVRTTNADMPEFVVPMIVRVSGGVTVIPPRVPLGRCKEGVPGPWFEVLVEGVASVRLGEVRAGAGKGDGDVLDIAHGTSDRGPTVRIRYTGEPSEQPNLAATVVLRVQPGDLIVNVPVYGEIERDATR
jgi:hypothetical protein